MKPSAGSGSRLPVLPLLPSQSTKEQDKLTTKAAIRDQPYTQDAPSIPQNSTDLVPPILARANGVVLDIGPGTGSQMPLLRRSEISAIYGAEPCVGLHSDLRKRAEDEGLGGTYRILGCSVSAEELAPALRKEGLLRQEEAGGVFDTILCVRVLCSIPEPEKTLRDLYALLKPGGQMLVIEHVVNPWRTAKGSFIARAMQGLYQMLGWSVFMGDCRLTRDTESALRGAADEDGGWERVELDSAFGRSPMAYISGVLVKRG